MLISLFLYIKKNLIKQNKINHSNFLIFAFRLCLICSQNENKSTKTENKGSTTY